MDDEAQWTDLERIFHAALALEPGQRAEYVRSACGEDEDLRRRVQSLLVRDDSSSSADTRALAGRRRAEHRPLPDSVQARRRRHGRRLPCARQPSRPARRAKGTAATVCRRPRAQAPFRSARLARHPH